MSERAMIPSYKDLLWPTLRAVREIGDSGTIQEMRVHLDPQAVLALADRCFLSFARPRYKIKEHRNGDRYREVVQRREGLRVHYARSAREGSLRPPHGDSRRRLSLARGGREGLIRHRGRAEGAQGCQRPTALA